MDFQFGAERVSAEGFVGRLDSTQLEFIASEVSDMVSRYNKGGINNLVNSPQNEFEIGDLVIYVGLVNMWYSSIQTIEGAKPKDCDSNSEELAEIEFLLAQRLVGNLMNGLYRNVEQIAPYLNDPSLRDSRCKEFVDSCLEDISAIENAYRRIEELSSRHSELMPKLGMKPEDILSQKDQYVIKWIKSSLSTIRDRFS